MEVTVNLIGLGLIALIVWWFWLSKPRTRRASADVIDVVVANGVYDPPRIEVPAGQPVTLRFLRRDPSPCAEQVRFDDLGISAELPVGEAVTVTIAPQPAGEYAFTCQMQMYRGSLLVKS